MCSMAFPRLWKQNYHWHYSGEMERGTGEVGRLRRAAGGGVERAGGGWEELKEEKVERGQRGSIWHLCSWSRENATSGWHLSFILCCSLQPSSDPTLASRTYFHTSLSFPTTFHRSVLLSFPCINLFPFSFVYHMTSGFHPAISSSPSSHFHITGIHLCHITPIFRQLSSLILRLWILFNLPTLSSHTCICISCFLSFSLQLIPSSPLFLTHTSGVPSLGPSRWWDS